MMVKDGKGGDSNRNHRLLCMTCRDLIVVARFDGAPIYNLPKGGEMGCTTVLIVEIVSMLPYIEGEKGLETFGNRIRCT